MPKITPQFLLDLIKRDAGIKKLGDNAKDIGRGIARTPGNIAGSLVDLIRMFAPTTSEVGSSEWINEKLGAPEVKGDAGKAAEIVASFISPETIAAKIAGVPVAAGILGGAGRQDLIISRQVPRVSINNRVGNSRLIPDSKKTAALPEPTNDLPQFRDPSFAVYKADRGLYDVPFYNHDTALVFPRPDFIDPATNRFSRLYNRDIYSPRSHGKSLASERLEPRLREGANPKNFTSAGSASHDLSILASKRFDSLADFEADKTGAGVLDIYDPSLAVSIRDVLDRALYKHTELSVLDESYKLEHFANSSNPQSDAIRNIILKIADKQNLAPINKHILNLAARSPSDYAELKYGRNFPITAETTLGMAVPEKTAKSILAELRDLYGRVGVPIVTYGSDFDRAEDVLNKILAKTGAK